MNKEALEKAIQLIRSGDKKTGGKILAEVVKQDPKNETAWLWLAACFESSEKKSYCLKKALEINPDNEKAWNALNKLSENEPAWQDRLNVAVEKDEITEPQSDGLIRGVTVFESVQDETQAQKEPVERSASFTGIFLLGFLTIAGLIAIALYVLISRGILFPPSPEKIYAREMRTILTEYTTWQANKASLDAALAEPYSGTLSATGGTSMTASDALFAYLALQTNPVEGVSSATARRELAALLQPTAEAATLSGQTILNAMDASLPPDEIQQAHQQFYSCIQQETMRAQSIYQIVSTGAASGFNITTEACAALPDALSILRTFTREH